MAIIKVTEQGHQRSANVSVASNGNTVGDAVRIFQVVSDVGYDDDLAIFNAVDPSGLVGVPSLFVPHPARPWLCCSSKGIRWLAMDGRASEVTCSYSFIPPFRLPWEQPPIYSGDANEVEQIADMDLATGKRILNSAKQPFDPALTSLRLDNVLNVARNELSPVDFSAFNGCVNSVLFKGAQRGYCRVKITWSEQIYIDDTTGAQTPYFAVAYQFQFKNPAGPGWQPKVADTGYMKLIPGPPAKLLTILSPDGREFTTPPFLDGAGGQLAANADPILLSFTTQPSQDLNVLGL